MSIAKCGCSLTDWSRRFQQEHFIYTQTYKKERKKDAVTEESLLWTGALCKVTLFVLKLSVTPLAMLQ